jgi:Holliday junction resolvasome RuvABC endonuclease subunit
MTTILGLDVAKSMGVCDWKVGQKPIFYTVALGREDDDKSIQGSWDKACRALRWIAERMRTFPPDEVVIEAPIPERALSGQTNAHSTMVKMMLIGVLGATVKLKHVRVTEANIQRVRKHFVGHGNLKSEEAKRLVRKVCREIGWDCNNYDESDAGAVAHWRATQLGLLVPDVKPFHYRKIAA